MKAFFLKYRKTIGIAIAVIVLLTLLFAPARNQDRRGSTYSRGPGGYGAWYAEMETQGAAIQRWRKPLEQLLSRDPSEGPITLLQVGQTSQWLQDRVTYRTELENWVQQGNRIIILGGGFWQGKAMPVTLAPFNSSHDTAQGAIAIATSRRFDLVEVNRGLERKILDSDALEGEDAALPSSLAPATVLVGDKFGGIAIREVRGEGDRIEAVTPYLAANAYQDVPGNFAWLAAQVGDGPIWVNEFSHGYKDRDALVEAGVKTWGDYFLRSPLVLFLIQGAVILVVAVVAQNRRWGPKQPVVPPPVNNSEAYMTALAGVLRRAGNSNFVLEQCKAAEQQRIQRQLGLGTRPLPLEELLHDWEARTGQSSEELRKLLVSDQPSRQVSEKYLVDWLKRSQALRQSLVST